jgi:C4-dicarboxylate-binding protein DctP
MLRLIKLTTALAAVLMSGSVAIAADPIIIKFSHVTAPDTPKGKGSQKFKELAEKYTNGAVKVEVYPNSQLYKDKEELEALQLGSVQMLAPSISKFGPFGIREYEVFDFPYVFPSTAVMRKVTEGPIGQELFKKLEPKGAVGLGYWDNGFKIMSANKPLRTPDDFLGLKMRIKSSKVLEAQMLRLGAVPQVMAFSEAYQALQTGVVDGTENTPANMYTQKMHEVQKHATLSFHGFDGYAVIVNKPFWDGLAPEVRAQLTKAMNEATSYTNSIAQKENDDALDAMKARGVTTFLELTKAERDAWREFLLPVRKDMVNRLGPDAQNMLDRIAEISKAEGF